VKITPWIKWIVNNFIPQITNDGTDIEKREPSYTTGGNVNWYSLCGKPYRDSSKS